MALVPAVSQAYLYVCGQYSNDRESYKWSTCKWLNDSNQSSNNLEMKGKPSKRDDVQMRARTDVIVDMDVDVNSFTLNGWNTVTFEGKSLKSKRGINFSIRWGGTSTELILKNSVADIGSGINIGAGNDNSTDSIGLAVLKLEDSVMNVNGSLMYSMSILNQDKNQPERGGADFILIGKSALNIKGDVFFDPVVLTSARMVKVKMDFEEKNGNVPTASFNGGTLSDIYIEIKITPSVKKGTYNILSFKEKKNQVKDINHLSLNGQDYKLDTPVSIGERTAVLKANAQDNGLVLEVK